MDVAVLDRVPGYAGASPSGLPIVGGGIVTPGQIIRAFDDTASGYPTDVLRYTETPLESRGVMNLIELVGPGE